MNWEVVGVASSVILVSLTSAGLAMVRTRTNAHRIGVLEKRMDLLNSVPADIRACQEQLRAQDRHSVEERKENREDHADIKKLIGESESRILTEVRKANGGKP